MSHKSSNIFGNLQELNDKLTLCDNCVFAQTLEAIHSSKILHQSEYITLWRDVPYPILNVNYGTLPKWLSKLQWFWSEGPQKIKWCLSWWRLFSNETPQLKTSITYSTISAVYYFIFYAFYLLSTAYAAYHISYIILKWSGISDLLPIMQMFISQ